MYVRIVFIYRGRCRPRCVRFLNCRTHVMSVFRSGRFGAASFLSRKDPSVRCSIPRAKHASYQYFSHGQGATIIADARYHLRGTGAKTKIGDGTQLPVGRRRLR